MIVLMRARTRISSSCGVCQGWSPRIRDAFDAGLDPYLASIGILDLERKVSEYMYQTHVSTVSVGRSCTDFSA